MESLKSIEIFGYERQINHFEWNEVSLIPKNPGLYAWYLKPNLRKADLGDYEFTKKNIYKLLQYLNISDINVNTDDVNLLDSQGVKNISISQLIETVI